MIQHYLNQITRLLIAPFKGAVKGTREAWSLPAAENWKQFIRSAIRRYFAPITGAYAEIKKEWQRHD